MANGLFDPSEIYNYLQSSGMLPKQNTRISVSGSEGTFVPSRNMLFAPPVINQDTRNTSAHELTHAVQYNMLFPVAEEINSKLEAKQKISEQEAAYLDAFRKLMPTFSSGASPEQEKTNLQSQNRTINKLYSNKSENEEFNKYRKSPEELQAFGVGNMSQTGQPKDQKTRPHLDPTMATEFSVLMGLYDKLPSSIKDLSLKTRQSKISDAPLDLPGGASLRFSKITEDPFKDTTKDY